MKPPAFEYADPRSLQEAMRILADSGGETKILAGGQSLVPMLNFRLLKPQILVDINRIIDLDFIEDHIDGGIRIGALTRHYSLETSRKIAEKFPVISEAIKHVAHLAIRNRGTIGGSLSHADPSAELALMAVLLDAVLVVESVHGSRRILARDFFVGALSNVLEENEIVREIELPALPPMTGWGFQEFAMRLGDFAIVAVATTITLSGGHCAACRIAITGGETPVRATDAEALLLGSTLGDKTLAAAAKACASATPMNSDLRASSEFRMHLVESIAFRVLQDARQRATGKRQ